MFYGKYFKEHILSLKMILTENLNVVESLQVSICDKLLIHVPLIHPHLQTGQF